jgi:hypothetical protein
MGEGSGDAAARLCWLGVSGTGRAVIVDEQLDHAKAGTMCKDALAC